MTNSPFGVLEKVSEKCSDAIEGHRVVTLGIGHHQEHLRIEAARSVELTKLDDAILAIHKSSDVFTQSVQEPGIDAYDSGAARVAFDLPFAHRSTSCRGVTSDRRNMPRP